MSKNKLKPCPFCGAHEVDLVKDGEHVFACCGRCCACTRYVHHDDRAIELWNKRDGDDSEC